MVSRANDGFAHARKILFDDAKTITFVKDNSPRTTRN
jgi:hypothetical protein